MRLNPYTAGNPIGGPGFFGRDNILREVMQVLRHPKSNAIVLYGQRRIGKTSMLLQLERQLIDLADYTPVYFDLQDKADKPLEDVLYELAQRICAVTGQATPEQDLFDSEGVYFRDVFVLQAAETRANSGLVLLFDEFDVLDSPKEDQAGTAFFPYLRQWMGEAKGVQFVFVIGRRPEDLSINTISTFKGVRATRVSLQNEEDAAAVVRQSQTEDSLIWPDEAVARVWYWVQGHPYFTQLLCSVVWENAYEDDPEEVPVAQVDDVDVAVAEALKQGANAFVWIWDGLPPAERVVISAMAEAEERIITPDGLVDILNQSGVRLIVRQLELAPETLVEWELLQPANGGYQFTVLLLRRWVQKNRPLNRTKEELDLLDPQAESLFQTGLRFYQSNQLGVAENQLRLALQSNPNHLKAQLLLGLILFEQKQLDEAVKILETAYQYDAGATRAELVKVLLAVADKQEESKQLDTYQRILEIEPKQPNAKEYILSNRFEEASQFEAEKRWSEAIQIYVALSEQFSDDERVKEKLRSARSSEYEQKILDQVKIATTLEKQERWQELIQIYTTLLSESPDEAKWQIRLEQAKVEHDLQQKYNEALGALETGNAVQAQRLLADVIHQRPDYGEAARYLLKATRGLDVAQSQADREKLQTPLQESEDDTSHQQMPPSPIRQKKTSNPQVPRRLSASSIQDYLRLLWWIFMMPQQLKLQKETYGDIGSIGKWLVSSLTWLPLLLLTSAIGLETVPHTTLAGSSTTYSWISGALFLAWLLTGWLGDKDKVDTVGVAIILTSLVTLGVAVAVAGVLTEIRLTDGIAIVVAVGVAVVVAVVVAFGVTGAVTGKGTGSITFGVAVSVTVIVTFGMTFILTDNGASDGGSVVLGVIMGIMTGVVIGIVMGSIAAGDVTGIVASGVAFGVALGVAFPATAIAMTNATSHGYADVVAAIAAGGVAVIMASIVARGVGNSIEWGRPSWWARGEGGLLLLSYAFIIWFAFLGGARVLAGS